MNTLRTYLLLLVFIPGITIAQRGPGGVTKDTDSQKNCRLWLDAGDLTNLADGDPVNVWHDKSVTAITVDDSAYWDPADAAHYLQPIFRDAPSSSINGKPVVSYEYGGMLKIGNWPDDPASPDINRNTIGYQTTYEQTIFVAFRTGNDVESNQTLWEEGGSNRGFKIYLRDDSVFIAAYDDIGNDNDPRYAPSAPRVPAFGFSYKGQPIQSNSTYVLSLVYNVPKGQNANDGNKLITNTYNPNPTIYTGLTGTLNGNPFPDDMLFGCCKAHGVGGVSYHPDPIGVGGLNRTSYDETGKLNESKVNGDRRMFQGRLAEICYYAYAMNDAERIIVENYLAAKYFANVIYNDKYEYEAGYGDGVIGVGKQLDGVSHNISQGDNLFEISVNMGLAFPSNAPYYLLTGHNNASISWTNHNTPDSASIHRLQRIWRWDRQNTAAASKLVTIKLYPQDISELPPLPAGYTKYGILQEHSSNYLPNFSASNSTVTELFDYGTFYQSVVNIEDGEFFTLCAIKPTAQFESFSDYAVEGNPAPPNFSKRAKLVLNYKPKSNLTTTVGIKFVDGSATTGTDYNHTQTTATYAIFKDTTSVAFEIINNITADPPPTKNFKIIIDPATSDPGVTIGARDTLDFSIYDDDPDPKMTFLQPDSTISEGAGLGRIQVRITGNTTIQSEVRIVRLNTAVSGTATYLNDYTLPVGNGWYSYNGTMACDLIIPPGLNKVGSVYFPILDDVLDEYDETIKFTLQSISGAGANNGSILNHTVIIADNDLEPVVKFAATSSEGYEAINNPRIYIELSSPSEKQITVDYAYIGGTATPSPLSGSDFSSPSSGTVVFPAGSIEEYITLVVYSNDSTPEPDNTVIFQLSNPVNASLNASLDPQQHIYTIKNYTEFEWQGVAGVGKFQDNTFWMVPDAATSGPGANIPNLSPRPVNIIQDESNKRPTVTSAESGLNNHKLVVFDGNDHLKVGGPGSSVDDKGQFPLINTGGQYDRKSLFFMFSPDVVDSDTPQVIYEQGGGSNGLSIYIIQNKLYFYMWFISSSPYSPWGLVGNNSNANNFGQAYIESNIDLQAGHNYIVSCHYSRNWGFDPNNLPPLAGMHMYIDGVLEGSYTTDSGGNYRVGRMLKHTGYTSIGAMWYQGKVHNNKGNGPAGKTDVAYYYQGKLGEFLYFNEPTMTEARVRILHNYLASKYNLTLNSGQDFDLNHADNTPSATDPAFNYQMAGVGQVGAFVHGDSQGLSELRVTNPIFTQNPAFLNWGNNGESLTTTWPYSNTYLPATIMERSGKTWRFSTSTGGVTFADFLIRFNTAQNAPVFQTNSQFLKLLVNTSGDPNDFSNAAVYSAEDPNPNGNIAKFSHVAITDGMYVSLANTSAIYPLPIEILNFTAKLMGNYVDLNWATASEINNEYFLIERAGGDLKWEELIQVSGAGNSNTTLYYNEKDRDPLLGISYYRLKQVDFDGKYKYSDVVSVINRNTELGDDVYLFPNPSVGNSVFIRVPHAYSQLKTQVSFYNMSGVAVWQKQLETDETLFELNYGDLPAGVYIVQIRNEAINESKKLVIQ